MTRILVVSNLIPSVVQPGRSAPLWNYIKYLARIADVTAIGPRFHAPPWSPYPLHRFARDTPRHEILDGVPVDHPRYVMIPRFLREVQGWSYRAMLGRRLDALPASDRPDVILSIWSYPDAYASVLEGHRRGIPVAAMVIGSDVNSLPGIGLEGPIRTALSEADRVITVCEDLRRVAQRLGAAPDRVDVVLNGVELERFKPGPRAEARASLGVAADAEVVLFLGNLYPVKGPDVLLDAWASVRARRPRAHLYFVGDGPLQAPLAARVRKEGLADCVTFAGRRPHEEVPRWQQAANLTVLSSRSEGIPNALLEALACGTPVVATDVGGVAEALPASGAGRLVPKENPAALADALVATLAEDLQPAAVRSTVQLHSWADAAQRMLESLQRAIAGARVVRTTTA